MHVGKLWRKNKELLESGQVNIYYFLSEIGFVNKNSYSAIRRFLRYILHIFG
jgi:hypothetical protein